MKSHCDGLSRVFFAGRKAIFKIPSQTASFRARLLKETAKPTIINRQAYLVLFFKDDTKNQKGREN